MLGFPVNASGKRSAPIARCQARRLSPFFLQCAPPVVPESPDSPRAIETITIVRENRAFSAEGKAIVNFRTRTDFDCVKIH